MKRIQEDERLLSLIRPLKADHPFWGYRRIWAYMKYRLNQPVNKKRILRIMRENDLLVKPNLRLKATRDNQNNRSKPKATRVNQFWGIDMTKVMIPSWGWLYLVVVLDWFTKKIVGSSVSACSKANDWLDAIHIACNQQFPEGVTFKKEDLFMVSDNGSQPTSKTFMCATSVMEIKQIFASYNNPKGNADTERVIRTIKEDFIWVSDYSSPIEFTEGFKAWIERYNSDYPHSSLKYLTPCQFEKEQLQLTTKI